MKYYQQKKQLEVKKYLYPFIYCEVLDSTEKQLLPSSVSIAPHCQRGDMSKVFKLFQDLTWTVLFQVD